jgi:hypothetical protein
LCVVVVTGGTQKTGAMQKWRSGGKDGGPTRSIVWSVMKEGDECREDDYDIHLLYSFDVCAHSCLAA